MLPPALFSPLASPGAPIYAAVLLSIFADPRHHQQPLSRELAASLVHEVLADSQHALEAIGDVGEAADSPEDDDPLAARAGAVLRYLT